MFNFAGSLILINMNDSGSSLPSLSPGLNSLYSSLDVFNRGVFVKIYKYLWGVVLPYRRLGGPLGSVSFFWALDNVLNSLPIPVPAFSLLTFIYQATGRGTKYISSVNVFNSGAVLSSNAMDTKRYYISLLTKAGYLVRSHVNYSDNLNYKRAHRKQYCFIKLSPSGVKLIEQTEKDLYKLLLNTSLGDLTGKQ